MLTSGGLPGSGSVAFITSDGRPVFRVGATTNGLTSDGEPIFGLPATVITGSAAQTVPAFTSTGAGVHGVAGAGAQTIGDFTSAGAGVLVVVGTAAQTIPDFVSTGAGTAAGTGATGTAAQTVPDFASTGAGAHGVAGTGAQTVANFASLATGIVVASGVAAQTIPAFTSTGTGIRVALPGEAVESPTGGWAEAARARQKKKRGPDPAETARRDLKAELRRIAGEDAPEAPETAPAAPEERPATETSPEVMARLEGFLSPLAEGAVALPLESIAIDFAVPPLAAGLSGQITDGAPVVPGVDVEINRLAAENAALRQTLTRQRAAFVLLLNG